MQFKKSVVVGVLITLYLSTESWCHYIPEKKNSSLARRNAGSSSNKDRIQICGDALTTMIIEACDGIVGSPHQGNFTKESLQTKITEDCCDHECSIDYVQSYCGQTPLFTTKNKIINRVNGANRNSSKPAPKNKKKKEVRIKEKADRRKRGKRGRKKRKRSFKRKCTYKSFGHYLLNLDWNDRVRSNISKRQNTMNITWPSIQIGTIAPDQFGGQPIVVIKKNPSTSA